MMTLKKTQIVQVNKDNGKIVITQSKHDTIGPMTCSKAKTFIKSLAKQTSGHTHLLKPVETHNLQLPIILASLGVKGQSFHGGKKTPLSTKGL